MSKVTLSPSRLEGEVSLPPSKSFAHRAVICASLAKGRSVISPIDLSDDIAATIAGCRMLGADITLQERTLIVNGENTGDADSSIKEINCFESGSTLRFLIPVAAALGVDTRFIGHGRLPQRPIDIYTSLLPEFGVTCHSVEHSLPLRIGGRLQAGDYHVPGDISSQFITGLLFALPLCDGDSQIILTSPLQSSDYVKMTLETLKSFHIEITETTNGYAIRGNQSYQPCDYTVEGDWSQASFFLAAGAINSSVILTGLREDSVQGDRVASRIFSDFGADIHFSEGKLYCSHRDLHSLTIDAMDIPDMVPALAVTAAYCDGITTITGAQRLKMKESNRLFSTAQNLRKLGCAVEDYEDRLIIRGNNQLQGANLFGFNDHRIVMAFSIAALGAEGDVSIADAESIRKSYPNFFEDYQKLGGIANVVGLW